MRQLREPEDSGNVGSAKPLVIAKLNLAPGHFTGSRQNRSWPQFVAFVL